MKKSLLVTALALLLALGTLIGLTVRLDGTATPVGVKTTHVRGDASAAEGLTVHTALTYADNLHWTSDYLAAEGTEESSFFARLRPVPKGTPVEWVDLWYITRLCLTESGEYVTEDLLTGDDWPRSREVRVGDAFASYGLYLDAVTLPAGDEDTLISMSQTSSSLLRAPFDKLRIPVGPEDRLEERVHYRDTNGYEFAYQFIRRETRFTPYTLGRQDHVLVTVGFAADAPAEPSWAPEGFGIWDVPIVSVKDSQGNDTGARRPDAEQATLLYPLDIVEQRVAALTETADGAILLVTAEDGRFVLRVLDGEACRLRREMDLGEADQVTRSDGNETHTSFCAVQIRVEDEFVLMTLNGRELLVLDRSDGEWGIALRSPVMELDEFADGEAWRVSRSTAARENGIWDTFFTLADPGTLQRNAALSFHGGKLTAALYPPDNSVDKVCLQIYGDGGLLYGALLENNLTPQIFSKRFFVSRPVGEEPVSLRWAD
ncbi:MAG: hypothetical protein II458_07065 [Oscillospiraceae bacterium]|nr:hypothetical protein [Oscillospiraceae bacterium]